MKKIIMSVMLFTATIFGISAFDGEIEFKQSDGSNFIGNLKGDEWFSWVEDKKGNIIKYNFDSKNYEYAKIEVIDSMVELVPSGMKVEELNESNTTINSSSGIEVGKIDKKTLSDIWNRKRDKALHPMVKEKLNRGEDAEPKNK